MRYALILFVLLAGCPGPGPGPVPPQPDPFDPTIDDSSNSCASADKNLQKVCPDHAKTPAGKSFTDFCKETIAHGQSLKPSCIAKAKDCASADACFGSN